MAPYDNPPSATLTTKISPLIDGQLPDFVRDENPLFSKLLQYYYEYLEAAELLVDAQVDNILHKAPLCQSEVKTEMKKYLFILFSEYRFDIVC